MKSFLLTVSPLYASSNWLTRCPASVGTPPFRKKRRSSVHVIDVTDASSCAPFQDTNASMLSSASILAEISVRSPRIFFSSLAQKIFSVSKYPKMIYFICDNRSTDAVPSWRRSLRCCPEIGYQLRMNRTKLFYHDSPWCNTIASSRLCHWSISCCYGVHGYAAVHFWKRCVHELLDCRSNYCYLRSPDYAYVANPTCTRRSTR